MLFCRFMVPLLGLAELQWEYVTLIMFTFPLQKWSMLLELWILIAECGIDASPPLVNLTSRLGVVDHTTFIH